MSRLPGPQEMVWQSGCGPETLSSAEVHLWKLSLGQLPARFSSYREVLSPEERRRTEGLDFMHERASFCLCRGFLRMLLARYVNVAPQDVRFAVGKCGKPTLDPRVHKRSMEFNISHSGRMAIFALARERRVGADVQEILGAARISALGPGFLAPQEDASIRGLPDGARVNAFHTCWARKEAAVKALGGSMAALSGSVIVSSAPGMPPRLLGMPSGSGGPGAWRLYDLAVGEEYAAALCCEGPEAELFLWEPFA